MGSFCQSLLCCVTASLIVEESTLISLNQGVVCLLRVGLSKPPFDSELSLLAYIVQGSIVHQLSDTEVGEDFAALGFGEELVLLLLKRWKEGRSDAGHAALAQTLRVNQLLDMQWRFGVTAANSEIRHLGSTFLQMMLTLDMGNTQKKIRLELTLPQFYDFLAQMEKAKAMCDFLG